MSQQKQPDAIDEVTRRQWLLMLGQLTTVAGFSGIVPDFATALDRSEGQQTRAFPPGLYHPSQEHLSHAFGELGSLHRIPPGSETDYARPGPSPFRFFPDEELKVVSRVVQILLGNVDAGALSQAVQWLDLYLYSAAGVLRAALNLDPLHRALAVAYYGETAVCDLETTDPGLVVHSGIAALQQLSREQYGYGFLAIDESQQAKLVSTISTEKPEAPLRRFYELMRTEVIRGYYTSAEGLRDLDYKGNLYYTACPGCERK